MKSKLAPTLALAVAGTGALYVAQNDEELIIPPPVTHVIITWDKITDPFTESVNIYSSHTLEIPIKEWKILTNVPNTSTSVVIKITKEMQFFVVGASNKLGVTLSIK